MTEGPYAASADGDVEQIADQLIRTRVHELAKQVLPELEMPELTYEARTSGSGWWVDVGPARWLQLRAAGREVRTIANYDSAHRVVMLFGGDS